MAYDEFEFQLSNAHSIYLPLRKCGPSCGSSYINNDAALKLCPHQHPIQIGSNESLELGTIVFQGHVGKTGHIDLTQNLPQCLTCKKENTWYYYPHLSMGLKWANLRASPSTKCASKKIYRGLAWNHYILLLEKFIHQGLRCARDPPFFWGWCRDHSTQFFGLLGKAMSFPILEKSALGMVEWLGLITPIGFEAILESNPTRSLGDEKDHHGDDHIYEWEFSLHVVFRDPGVFQSISGDGMMGWLKKIKATQPVGVWSLRERKIRSILCFW